MCENLIYLLFVLLHLKAFETQLAKVKQRVMTYLGRLGGEMNYTLLEGGDVCEEAIAWDAEQHLRFDVPFIDMKPQIYFGVLLLIFTCTSLLFFSCFLVGTGIIYIWYK